MVQISHRNQKNWYIKLIHMETSWFKLLKAYTAMQCQYSAYVLVLRTLTQSETIERVTLCEIEIWIFTHFQQFFENHFPDWNYRSWVLHHFKLGKCTFQNKKFWKINFISKFWAENPKKMNFHPFPGIFRKSLLRLKL